MKKIFVIFTTLYSVNAFALYTENIQNQCGIIGNNIIATFTINQYTCPAGQFLPAYTLGCRPCPEDYTCNGGTFVFNENQFQGAIKYSKYINHDLTNMCSENIPHNMNAIMTPNEHTCAPGYYLPANVDSCTICPAGNKCVGGTYSFNETDNQGIVSCNDYFAPIGSTNCYQHILHIGNDIVYLSSTKHTTPSLNVAYSNEVFYANMTTVPTVMTAGSSHYFKTIYNNTEYYICDNTSCPQ